PPQTCPTPTAPLRYARDAGSAPAAAAHLGLQPGWGAIRDGEPAHHKNPDRAAPIPRVQSSKAFPAKPLPHMEYENSNRPSVVCPPWAARVERKAPGFPPWSG